MDLQTNKRVPAIFNPATLYDPIPHGYSHGAVVPGGSRLIFVAGQGGEDPQGNLVPDFRLQVRQALVNVSLALEAQGSTMAQVVKLTTLIVDHSADKHHILIEESLRMWPGGQFPPQTLIPVGRLAHEAMLFEVEAVAMA